MYVYMYTYVHTYIRRFGKAVEDATGLHFAFQLRKGTMK